MFMTGIPPSGDRGALQPITTPLSEPERQLLVPYSTKANAFCGLHGSFFPIFFLPNSQKAFAFVEYGTRSCLSGSDRGVVNPDLLQSTYDDIVNKARAKSLNPLSNDADTLFQSPTSVIGTQEGDLLIVVHIPLYSGSLMRLYRYVSAPFPLKENIVATIRHDKEYLALDLSGTIGKELSATEILKCDRINRVFHCNGENILQKNLEQLCLCNLYNQQSKP